MSEFLSIKRSEGWLAEPRSNPVTGRVERPNMYILVEEFIKPKTAALQVAYAELLPPMAPEVFVSHWWGEEFLSFVETLRNFAMKKPKPGARVFWVCSFANRQWKVNLGRTLQESPFERALVSESCAQVLMVLGSNAMPLRRIWCLYEVLRTHALKKDCPQSRKKFPNLVH